MRSGSGSELVGPVALVDAAAKEHRRPRADGARPRDDRHRRPARPGGFAGIAVGMALEVHGTRDAVTGAIAATRIEPDECRRGFRLKGIVAASTLRRRCSPSARLRTSYASVPVVPANLANGGCCQAAQAADDASGGGLGRDTAGQRRAARNRRCRRGGTVQGAYHRIHLDDVVQRQRGTGRCER